MPLPLRIRCGAARRTEGTAISMEPPIVTLIGAGAAVLTTLCWLPQAFRILRSRDTAAISLTAYAVFAAGLVLWLTYGFLIGSWPVIGANLATLLPVAAIIVLKLRYG
jgi:MtN3 and saliva related transmembrane protein